MKLKELDLLLEELQALENEFYYQRSQLFIDLGDEASQLVLELQEVISDGDCEIRKCAESWGALHYGLICISEACTMKKEVDSEYCTKLTDVVNRIHEFLEKS